MYDDSDDGNDDGDDDCGYVLIPLSYYHSLISSYTRVSIVVLMNMLIYRMWNIYPLLQDGSDRGTTPVLCDPWDASPLTHGGPQYVQS